MVRTFNGHLKTYIFHHRLMKINHNYFYPDPVIKSSIIMREFTKLFIIILSIGALSIHTNEILAQGPDLNKSIISVPIPPAPDAASLGKFGEIPVSYYTGVPNINVPIYVLKTAQLSLPISLNYHASGVKIDDVASWVGLGWSLNAGGLISRTMRGIDDFHGTGGFQKVAPDLDFIATDFNSLTAVANGLMDTEPDLFYYNLPQASGKFVSEGPCQLSEQGDCSYRPLTYNDARILNNGDNTWTIITPNGITYHFGHPDNVTYYDRTESRTEFAPSDFYKLDNFISSWRLEKIVSADGLETISFEYESDEIAYNQIAFETEYKLESLNGDCDQLDGSKSYTTLTIDQSRLKRIVSSVGTIEFNVDTSSPRQDLAGSYALDNIIIRNLKDEIVRKFQLTYDYFDAGHNGGDPNYPGNQYRLKLVKVTDVTAPALQQPSHSFQYDESYPLPPRLSHQQDHWGYYNSNNKTTLIPKLNDFANGLFIIFDEGGNREVDPNKTTLGMLTRVSYPTGGYTQYEYEAHDYSEAENQPAVTFNEIEESVNSSWYDDGEDFVMITISNHLTTRLTYTLSNNNDLTPEPVAEINLVQQDGPYTYRDAINADHQRIDKELYIDLNAGTYKLSVESQYDAATNRETRATANIFLMDWDNVNETRLAGGARILRIINFDGQETMIRKFDYTKTVNAENVSSGELVTNPFYIFDFFHIAQVQQATQCHSQGFTSTSKTTLGTSNGSHIGYRKVTEYMGDNGENGYIEYHYAAPSDYPDAEARKFPYPPAANYDMRFGLLESQKIFNDQGTMVAETTNTYDYGHSGEVDALKVAIGVSGNSAATVDSYKRKAYSVRSESVYAKQTTQRTRAETGEYIENITSYFYEHPDYFQLTKSEEANSDGLITTSLFKYPFDYTGDPFEEMMGQNMVEIPIEEITEIGTTQEAVKAQFNRYKNDEGTVHPQSIYKANLPEAVPDVDFDTKTERDNYYEERVRYQRFENGNLVQVKGETGEVTSYLWGVDQQYVIAEIENATYEEVTTALGSDLALLQGHTLTEIQIQEKFESLRTALPRTFITSYTYDQLRGVSSKTDPNGIVRKYSYDALGRLQYILDENEHVLKRYDYRYANNVPVADFSILPGQIYVNDLVTYDGALSFDPDGDPLTYSWDNGETAAITQETYAIPGDVTMSLTVTDNRGASNSVTKSISVINRNPIADFTISPATIYVNDEVTFDANGSSDPDNNSITYSWDIGGTAPVVTKTYYSPGTRSVRLTVTDEFGATGIMTKTFEVVNRPPIANFNLSATTVEVDELFTADASASTDPDGDAISYAWSVDGIAQGTDVTLQHFIGTPGVFPVALKVTDSHGAYDIATINVTVNTPPFTISGKVRYSDGTGIAGEQVQIIPGGESFTTTAGGNYILTVSSPAESDVSVIGSQYTFDESILTFLNITANISNADFIVQGNSNCDLTASGANFDYNAATTTITTTTSQHSFSVTDNAPWISTSNITATSFDLSVTSNADNPANRTGQVIITDISGCQRSYDVVQEYDPSSVTCPSGCAWDVDQQKCINQSTGLDCGL